MNSFCSVFITINRSTKWKINLSCDRHFFIALLLLSATLLFFLVFSLYYFFLSEKNLRKQQTVIWFMIMFICFVLFFFSSFIFRFENESITKIHDFTGANKSHVCIIHHVLSFFHSIRRIEIWCAKKTKKKNRKTCRKPILSIFNANKTSFTDCKKLKKSATGNPSSNFQKWFEVHFYLQSKNNLTKLITMKFRIEPEHLNSFSRIFNLFLFLRLSFPLHFPFFFACFSFFLYFCFDRQLRFVLFQCQFELIKIASLFDAIWNCILWYYFTENERKLMAMKHIINHFTTD